MSWALDFFTVTIVGFGWLYVLVVLEHGRRRVVHWAVTAGPAMAWVIQQLREATAFGLRPQYLFRDNDRIYGQGVAGFMKSCQIEEVRTGYGCPWQNPTRRVKETPVFQETLVACALRIRNSLRPAHRSDCCLSNTAIYRTGGGSRVDKVPFSKIGAKLP